MGKAWRFGLRPAWQKSRTASVAFVPPGNCAVVCCECLSMLTFRITVKAGLQRTTPNAASPIQAWSPLPRGGRVCQLAGGRRTLRHQTGSRGMEKVNAPSIASCRAFTETCERPFHLPGVGLPPKGNPISAARRSSVKICRGWSIASSRQCQRGGAPIRRSPLHHRQATCLVEDGRDTLKQQAIREYCVLGGAEFLTE